MHGGLLVAEDGAGIAVAGGLVALLERLERCQLIEHVAGPDDVGVVETAVLAIHGGVEAVMARVADDEVGPAELRRPLVLAAESERGDAGFLELLPRRRGSHPRC